MTVHVAVLGPGGCVEAVLHYEDDAELPEGGVVLSSFQPLGAPPGEGFQLHVVDGVLAWQDGRTNAERSASVRSLRDQHLAASDWVVTRAMERAEPVPAAWAVYRQALRDITLQPGFPTDIDWPVEPA